MKIVDFHRILSAATKSCGVFKLELVVQPICFWLNGAVKEMQKLHKRDLRDCVWGLQKNMRRKL